MALTAKAFEEDVAAIFIKDNQAESFGSGRLIAPGLVLTARHVVEAPKGSPRDVGWKVRLLRDRSPANRRWPGDPIEAKVVWRGRDTLDLALLQLGDGGAPTPTTEPCFSSYGLNASLNAAVAIGFPKARIKAGNAQEYKAEGQLSVLTDLPYEWTIPIERAPDDPENWVGMSGAAVCAEAPNGNLYLLGVAQEVPAGFSRGKLEVARLEAAFADMDFTTVLETALGESPTLVAWPAPEPQYRAQLPAWPSPLAAVVHLFDRREYADYIGGIIAAGPQEIALTGIDDDMLDLFVRRLEERTLPRRDPCRPGEKSYVRQAMVTISWTALPLPEMRWSFALQELQSRVAVGEVATEMAMALRRALAKPDTPAWVDLRIDASEFGEEDVVPLRDWRRAWHEAGAAGPLPPCGVIYTIGGVAGALPTALSQALAPLGGEKRMPVLPMRELSDVNVREWHGHLREFGATPALLAAAERLDLSFPVDRFRMRALDRYLKTGTLPA